MLGGWWAAMMGAVVGLVAVIPGWILMMYTVFPYVSAYEEIAKRCARCGYNLTGNSSGICPECGIAISEGIGGTPRTAR